ncbi:MAG: hypothetical protein ACOZBW_08690 [Thermodesulfobacteriota bacterium]
MRQVKGSMFIMFAKAVRADKSGTLDQFLTDEDRAILAQRVLPANWYPFDTYKRCFAAVSTVVAKDSPATLIEWGRQYGETTMSSIYKTVLQKKDALSAVEAYGKVLKNQFDFGGIEAKMVSENEMTIKTIDFDPDFVPWYYVAQGWLERTIQLAIGKPVRSDITARSWDGAPATVFRMRW